MVDKNMRSEPAPTVPFLLIYVLSLAVFFSTVSEAVCNLQDRDSLLLFSSNVSSPLSPLHWNSSIDCCSWEGISCDDSTEQRVTAILLPSRGLSGTLPSSVLNLPRLSRLDLSSNSLSGPLPQGFFSVLDHLTVLDLSNNSFTGPIPSFICKTSPQLTKLDFSYNRFRGVISQGLGSCLRLRVLRAGFNNIFGEIPKDIYDLSDLEELILPVNDLSGKIDDGITRLTKLRFLELYFNNLQGEIPMDIGKLFNLRRLELHNNNLTGSVPVSLANCTSLVKLNLRVNRLGGTLSELDFSRLQSLSILDLGDNSFTGDFPSTVFSCKNMTAMRFAGNKLTGHISPKALELEFLSFFAFSDNNMTNITGALSILQGCKKLSTLIIAKNFYDETIPSNEDFLASHAFPSLQIFGCNGSRLKGEIPAWLGTLPSLFYLDLSDNLLTGELSKELFQLSALMSQKVYDATERSYLELPVFISDNDNNQYNQISSLPPSIYITRNQLSGIIPVEIGKLKVIMVLELQGNNFSGSIPFELSNLTNLERLDLSNNKLSGRIPWSLTVLHFMTYFNVANNTLSGPIPTGSQFDSFPKGYFEGNPLLCRQTSCTAPTQPSTTKMSEENVSIMFVWGIVIGYFISLSLTLVMYKRKVNLGNSENTELEISSEVLPGSEKDMSPVMLFGNSRHDVRDLTIFELLRATNNFSQANIIGFCGFGIVYKAILDNGTKLAVKKLSGDYGLMEKQFKVEVEVLSRAKHENLVALQGYWVHYSGRVLIYSFMENKSLDYWLHENLEGPAQLDWLKRLHIMKGASYGLAYMHQVCEPRMVHQNIKSSNILLDGSFKAYLADFGLSRLFLPYRNLATTEHVGTLGYTPPEYGKTWIANLRGDMYSFGVVMLEILTGKRPMEVFRPTMSRGVVAWVHQMRMEGKPEEVFDPSLRESGYEGEMLSVLDIAFRCVNQNPMKRPNIHQVVDWLNGIGAENINQSNR